MMAIGFGSKMVKLPRHRLVLYKHRLPSGWLAHSKSDWF